MRRRAWAAALTAALTGCSGGNGTGSSTLPAVTAAVTSDASDGTTCAAVEAFFSAMVEPTAIGTPRETVREILASRTAAMASALPLLAETDGDQWLADAEAAHEELLRQWGDDGTAMDRDRMSHRTLLVAAGYTEGEADAAGMRKLAANAEIDGHCPVEGPAYTPLADPPVEGLLVVTGLETDHTEIVRLHEAAEADVLATAPASLSFLHVGVDGTVVGATMDTGELVVLDRGAFRPLLAGTDWYCPSWLADGTFYARRGTDGGALITAHFAADGTPIEELASTDFLSAAPCIVTDGSQLVWWAGSDATLSADSWIGTTDGEVVQVIAGRADCNELAQDLHGTLLVYTRACSRPSMNATIVVDLERGTETVIAPASGGAHFSPDGRFVAFGLHGADGTYDVWIATADGSQATLVQSDATWPAWDPTRYDG